MNYRSAVGEAKRLIKRSEEDQWRLAELTADVLASGVRARQWANDIGWRSQSSVTAYRQIWERYGGLHRNERPRFVDAYASVQAPGGEEVEAPDRWRQARERQVPTRHSDKVDMARTLLSEPQVAQDVLREPSVREPLINALAQPTPADPAREPRPRDANTAALAQIARAHDLMEAANRTVEPDHLTEEQGAKAEVMLRALESEIGAWRVNAGGGISDAAIAQFMEEGA